MPHETQNECHNDCQKNQDCSWYSYRKSTELCILFNNCPSLNENDVEFVSSQVECWGCVIRKINNPIFLPISSYLCRLYTYTITSCLQNPVHPAVSLDKSHSGRYLIFMPAISVQLLNSHLLGPTIIEQLLQQACRANHNNWELIYWAKIPGINS